MSKAVFILGAGASKPFKIPILKDIFKDPNAREYINKNTSLSDYLQKFFWGPRGHNIETSDQSLTVEEILTIIRDFEKQKYVNTPVKNVETFKRSLYILIKKAVYDNKSSQSKYLNPLINFADKNFEEITWASFNWDCIFEASFYYI